jgi:hypothetical protein
MFGCRVVPSLRAGAWVRLYFYASASSGALLSETLTPRGTTFPSCLVLEGDGIVCLGGTGKAYTVAQVVDDGDGSFVIEDAANTDCRCPTPHQPLFHGNQLKSCLFVHFSLSIACVAIGI